MFPYNPGVNNFLYFGSLSFDWGSFRHASLNRKDITLAWGKGRGGFVGIMSFIHEMIYISRRHLIR